MSYVSCVLFAIVVLLVLLFSRILIYIDLNGNGYNIHIGYLYFLKLQLMKNRNGVDQNGRHKTEKCHKEKEENDQKSHKFMILARSLAKNRKLILELMSHISMKMDFSYSFFFLEPKVTATACGVFHILAFNIDRILCGYLKSNDSKIRFTPSFAKPVNEFKANMCLSTRMGYLIIFILKFLPKYLKEKKHETKVVR